MNHLVFVYGTLKKNESNHGWMCKSFFVKEAVTAKEYLLYDLGAYPCLVKAPHGKGRNIRGELYEVTDGVLKGLDVLEGVAHGHYERVRIKLLKTKELVWGYLYPHDVSRFRDAGDFWTGREGNHA